MNKETWKESVEKMTEETRTIIQKPTIKYEVHQVIGGRAPKLEVTIKFSGDAEQVAENLVNKRYEEIFNMSRNMINKEMRKLNLLLQKEPKEVPSKKKPVVVPKKKKKKVVKDEDKDKTS
jgi:hypothetical protein